MKHQLVMYGGAFNPPHLDHLGKDGILGKLLEQVAEKVLIIPTGERTDKSYHGVTYRDRIHMLELATAEFGEKVEIDTVCMDGYVDSTTMSQVRYLKRVYGYDVPQVFGADVASRMAEWDPSRYVAQTLPKVFVSRPGHDIIWVDNYQILPFESHGFSSTDVRREVARILDGESCTSALRGVVHERVLSYILEHRLFPAS